MLRCRSGVACRLYTAKSRALLDEVPRLRRLRLSYRRLARPRRGSRRSTTKIRRIGKSANLAVTDPESKSDKQNQIRLQSTRRRRTVRTGNGESTSWAHDGQSPIAYIKR